MHRIAAAAIFVMFVVACNPEPEVNDESKYRVALLLAPSGRGDRSYNDMALKGLSDADEDSTVETMEILPASQADYEGLIRDLAEAGTDLIIGVGFTYVDAFERSAGDYPKVYFLLIDGSVSDAPNVRSVEFRAEEGSFLAGAVAARRTESGVVGFIGGMDIPIINTFRCGFESGVQYVNQQTGGSVEVRSAYVGSTPDAFANPAAGRDLARLMYGSGVDIIYHASGKSGNGIIQAADDVGGFVIGVDTDQSYLAPDAVLTSMRKRIDLVVEEGVKDLLGGEMVGGGLSLGVKEKGVDLVIQPERGEGLSESLQRELGALKEKISSGEIVPCVSREA